MGVVWKGEKEGRKEGEGCIVCWLLVGEKNVGNCFEHIIGLPPIWAEIELSDKGNYERKQRKSCVCR